MAGKRIGWELVDESTFSGGGLTLGETSLTAYRGDRGKTAYDHSQTAHAPSDADNTDSNLKNNGNELTSLEDTDRLLVVQLVEGEPQVVGWIQYQNIKKQLKDYFDTLYDPL